MPVLKKLLATDRDSNDAAVLIALIEAGLNGEARTRAKAMWRDSNFFNSLEYGSHQYTKSLDEAMPEFLKLFKDDDDKFFAELFFASFPNSKKAGPKVESKPKERLTVLSKRFPPIKFKSKRTRQLAMILLSSSPDAGVVLREPLKELAADLKIEELVDSNNSSEMQMKLLAAWLSVEMQFENFDPVRNVYRQVNGLTDEQLQPDSNPFADNWEVRQLLSTVSESMSNSFSKQIEDGSTEKIEKIMPVLTELNSPSLEYKLSPELNVWLTSSSDERMN